MPDNKQLGTGVVTHYSTLHAGKMSETTDSIPALFASNLGHNRERRALGIISHGKLHWKSWLDLDDDRRKIFSRLAAVGVQRGERVAHWASNSYEWILVDLAILSLGAVHVPLHASLSGNRAVVQIEQSGSAKVIVDTSEKQSQIVDRLENCQILQHSGLLPAQTSAQPVETEEIEPEADDLATILFTSGTTGQPQGVMLSHRNLTSNAIATTNAVASPADETRLCFLPLSHIYARTCDLYSWLYRGSRLVLTESRDTILRDCRLVNPTALNGVPYFYQKVAQQLHATGRAGVPGALRQLLGGELKYCFCGGAALAPDTEKLFEQQQMPILSGYGLTEASPVVSATRWENYRRGTVGKPIPGVEVRISDESANRGEVMVRGPNVMQGYWEDSESTREVIQNGWLMTGDLGEFDPEGNLRILGRLKEILVLSTGKNVSPMAVEQRLAGSPLVESVCAVGEGRKKLGVLIVPNPTLLRQKIKEMRLWVWSRRRALTHPKVRALYRAEIDRLLADMSREEQIGPFRLLGRAFDHELGEATPKFSLRRDVIAENFSQEIEQMYRKE